MKSRKVFAFHENETPHDHYQLTRAFRGNQEGTALLVLTDNNIVEYSKYFDMIKPAGVVDISSGRHKRIWFFNAHGYRSKLVLKQMTDRKFTLLVIIVAVVASIAFGFLFWTNPWIDLVFERALYEPKNGFVFNSISEISVLRKFVMSAYGI